MAANRTTVLMYAHPTMIPLAKSIVEICSKSTTNSDSEVLTPRSQDSDVIRGITRTSQESSQYMTHPFLSNQPRKVILREDIQWEKFADGFPKLFINRVKDMAGRDVIYLASFHSADVIFEQLSIIYAIPRYLARSVIIIVPYFSTGTMERVDKEGQIATAKTLATLLSNVPLTARGPSQIMLFDIHALQERFYFSDNVIPRLESAEPLLLRQLTSYSTNEFVIAFPDDGATKRFGDMFNHYATVTCAKVRNGDQRTVVVKDGDPGGRKVIIIDDLVQTGGTLMECAKACMAKGALSISGFVTHAVFPDDSWRKFTPDSKPAVQFENFWITDSLPHSVEISKHKPFVLLSLADVIADRLLGYDLVPSM